MVKCILDGKVIELGGGKNSFEKGNPEPIEDPKMDTFIECIVDGVVFYIKHVYSSFTPPEPIMEKEIEEFGKNTKVVKDCFDENGRPRLKIVYCHTDWSDKDGHVRSEWFQRFLDAERDDNDEYCLETGNNVDPPRVIVVKQDKDYWPGSELEDPLVFERREAKEKEYKEAAPYKYKPDYKEVDPIHYFGDDGSRLTDDIEDRSRRMYENYINPDLPGCEFLMANISKSALIQWKRASYPKKPKKINSTLMEKRTLKKREKYAAGDFSLDGPIPKKRSRLAAMGDDELQ